MTADGSGKEDRLLDEATLALLSDWEQRAVASQFGHLEAAKHFRRKNIWLGFPVVILTTIVGTSVFASLSDADVQPWVRLLLGVVSIAAAVLAALQTFLGFAEQSSAHRAAGASYGAVGRRIEQATRTGSFSNSSVGEFMDEVRKQMDALASEAPTLPDHIYRRVMAEFELQHPKSGTPRW